jgi:uncharacterized protein (DUF4415 family)
MTLEQALFAASQLSEIDKLRLIQQLMKDMEPSSLDPGKPEVSPEQFAKSTVKKRSTSGDKAQVTLKLNRDVLEWFESDGQDYHAQINDLLRDYVKTQRSVEL